MSAKNVNANLRRLAAVCVLLCGCASAPTHATGDAAQTLAAAERAFAQDASARTVNEAFLNAFAADATLFRPLPVDARKALAERPMAAALDLKWTPIHAEASADGSLGFTTGPATLGRRGAPPQGGSYFVSVWKRAGKEWKLRTDAGMEINAVESLDSAAQQLTTKSGSRRFKAAGMLQEEQRLGTNYAVVFAQIAADNVRVYRSGSLPATTRAAALELIGRDSAATYVPTASEVAGSGDLGFVYGLINPKSDHPHAYERIYRRDASGRWRIAVDWRN